MQISGDYFDVKTAVATKAFYFAAIAVVAGNEMTLMMSRCDCEIRHCSKHFVDVSCPFDGTPFAASSFAIANVFVRGLWVFADSSVAAVVIVVVVEMK